LNFGKVAKAGFTTGWFIQFRMENGLSKDWRRKYPVLLKQKFRSLQGTGTLTYSKFFFGFYYKEWD